jgi:hypothetical protein
MQALTLPSLPAIELSRVLSRISTPSVRSRFVTRLEAEGVATRAMTRPAASITVTRLPYSTAADAISNPITPPPSTHFPWEVSHD